MDLLYKFSTVLWLVAHTAVVLVALLLYCDTQQQEQAVVLNSKSTAGREVQAYGGWASVAL